MGAFQLAKENMKMLFYGVFIIFVATVLVIGGRIYLDQDVNTSYLENELVISRLLYSDDCFIENGVVNIDKFYEEKIIKCSGITGESGYGLRLRLYNFDNSSELVKEIELNKDLTSQCLITNIKNIGRRYFCSSSKHYVFYEDNKGILEVVVANDIKK
jgi:hypothetical protein|tara:strand:+ start:626 stop:1099 length:474 start_codon:yes stop_codon:yes gene_type:complete